MLHPRTSHHRLAYFRGNCAVTVNSFSEAALRARQAQLGLFIDRAMYECSDQDESGRALKYVRAIVPDVTAAERPPKWLPWLGRWIRLEYGWQTLHIADEAFLMVAPDAMVLARGSAIVVDAEVWFGKDDPRVCQAKQIVVAHQHEKHSLSRSDRYALVDLVYAVHTIVDRSHAQARSFRRLLAAAFVLLMIGVALLVVAGAIWPHSVPLCSAGDPRANRLPVCPTGQNTPTGGDVMLVALIGMIAAGVSAVASISNLGSLIDPFHTPIWQGMLKIPVGAFTAVLGVLAIEEGLDAGAGIPTTQGGILFLGFVFGYSQQLFTRVVDARGSRIRAGLVGPLRTDQTREF